MDGWTDGRTDKVSHRDARTHLKSAETFFYVANKLIFFYFQVAGLVQSTSTDTEDGKKLARALGQLQALYPQVKYYISLNESIGEHVLDSSLKTYKSLKQS